MKQYRDLIIKVLDESEPSNDRTGTGTYKIFGHRMTFNCTNKFPLVTSKYTHFPAILHELLWFISGSTNIEYLKQHDIKIWDGWADDNGEVGPIYGGQWRNAHGIHRKKVFGEWQSDGIDQLQNCIDTLKDNPNSRRMIVDCWMPKLLPDESISPKENPAHGLMALAPCHMMFQFFVRKGYILDIQMYQRSVDVFLGLPFNIASYAILLSLVAKVTDLTPGKLHWVGGDIHIYTNHVDQVRKMLRRSTFDSPTLEVNDEIRNINDFTDQDILLHDYQFHPPIKAPISV